MRPFGGGSRSAFGNGADFPRADFTQPVQRLTAQARPGRVNPVRPDANPGARSVARWTQFLPAPTPKLLRKDEALQRVILPPTATFARLPRAIRSESGERGIRSCCAQEICWCRVPSLGG